MITKIFPHIGDKLSVADAYCRLMDLNPMDKCNKQKAAGSLGGASRSGFITLVDGFWVRTR